MTRYWFEFDSGKSNNVSAGLLIGCGVTAFDFEDAIFILEEKVFKGKDIPEFKDKKKDIDIRTLDQKHIIPNMKDPTVRGVWFPLGYE